MTEYVYSYRLEKDGQLVDSDEGKDTVFAFDRDFDPLTVAANDMGNTVASVLNQKNFNYAELLLYKINPDEEIMGDPIASVSVGYDYDSERLNVDVSGTKKDSVATKVLIGLIVTNQGAVNDQRNLSYVLKSEPKIYANGEYRARAYDSEGDTALLVFKRDEFDGVDFTLADQVDY